MKAGSIVVAGLFLAAMLSVSAMADTPRPSAVPGSLNYIEGHASIGSQVLNSKSIGTAELQTGQTLTTQEGKAEVLLTPGVFLRLGSNSSVKMVSPSLINTQVVLEQGHAILEVDELHKENDIRIAAGGSTVEPLKTGLYDIDLRNQQLRVFDGKASVMESDEHATVKGGHELSLDNTAGKLKSTKFNKKQNEQGDLYKWSSLRSSYLAEANVNAAGLYADYGMGPWGPGWWGADWYWDPWFDTFTFIPGDGIFYSPFGWGFYSPWWVTEAPLYGYFGYGYGYGYPYRYGGYRPAPIVRHFSTDPHTWGPGTHYVASSNYSHGIYRGPGSVGGFHSGGRVLMGTPGGGFGRFGGGGFHGGAMRGAVPSAGGYHGGGFRGGIGFHGR